jgi:hypothetical protein
LRLLSKGACHLTSKPSSLTRRIETKEGSGIGSKPPMKPCVRLAEGVDDPDLREKLLR